MTAIATMPQSIRVGYRTYRVEVMPAMAAQRNDRMGEHDPLHGVIRVRDDLDPVEAACTLLHELFHAMWRVGCADGGEEEKLVSVLANQLTQVWRDNPALVAWIGARLGDATG